MNHIKSLIKNNPPNESAPMIDAGKFFKARTDELVDDLLTTEIRGESSDDPAVVADCRRAARILWARIWRVERARQRFQTKEDR
jgi:hypothetical protein